MVKMYSNILVFIQFTAIAIMAYTGSWFAKTWPLLLIEISGVLLGVFSVFVMRIGNFNVRPIVKKNGKMVTSGPYKYIRHPMYASILLTLYPLLIEQFSWFRFAVMMILTITLVVKLNFEEGLLRIHFKNYQHYMTSSKRLIPFVY